jgi:hypothetical protein
MYLQYYVNEKGVKVYTTKVVQALPLRLLAVDYRMFWDVTQF